VKADRCFLQSVSVLVAFSIARSNGLVGPPLVSASILTTVLVLVAWRARATLADLGLARADVGPGLRWGAGAFGTVLLVLVVAALLPATNGFLHDSRAEISGGQLFYQLTVSILLVTAIPEEFAFRGVLLGSALRLWGSWRATLITSALFGLWHIGPTLHAMSDDRIRGTSVTAIGQVLVVIGAVSITFAAGLAFCWLRLRSRSLVAPIVAHMATNGIALAVAWFAVH
jgi:uncharacterized protein